MHADCPCDIVVTLAEESPLRVTLEKGGDVSVRLDAAVGNVEPVPVFDGEYDITPQAHEATVLRCEGMRMRDDVTVRKVPYFATTNPTGTTVYIASEVD